MESIVKPTRKLQKSRRIPRRPNLTPKIKTSVQASSRKRKYAAMSVAPPPSPADKRSRFMYPLLAILSNVLSSFPDLLVEKCFHYLHVPEWVAHVKSVMGEFPFEDVMNGLTKPHAAIESIFHSIQEIKTRGKINVNDMCTFEYEFIGAGPCTHIPAFGVLLDDYVRTAYPDFFSSLVTFQAQADPNRLAYILDAEWIPSSLQDVSMTSMLCYYWRYPFPDSCTLAYTPSVLDTIYPWFVGKIYGVSGLLWMMFMMLYCQRTTIQSDLLRCHDTLSYFLAGLYGLYDATGTLYGLSHATKKITRLTERAPRRMLSLSDFMTTRIQRVHQDFNAEHTKLTTLLLDALPLPETIVNVCVQYVRPAWIAPVKAVLDDLPLHVALSTFSSHASHGLQPCISSAHDLLAFVKQFQTTLKLKKLDDISLAELCEHESEFIDLNPRYAALPSLGYLMAQFLGLDEHYSEKLSDMPVASLLFHPLARFTGDLPWFVATLYGRRGLLWMILVAICDETNRGSGDLIIAVQHICVGLSGLTKDVSRRSTRLAAFLDICVQERIFQAIAQVVDGVTEINDAALLGMEIDQAVGSDDADADEETQSDER
jgi:hypothetical protein